MTGNAIAGLPFHEALLNPHLTETERPAMQENSDGSSARNDGVWEITLLPSFYMPSGCHKLEFADYG
jgi:hypothetical protein